ncbi:MAG: C40 family peptidase [Planctomycetes bacterium]|nr:C40 family peptidase [Planctomycetota bacterium]
MSNRARFVEVVRGYVGTPYQHLGRLPGVGLDCAGVPLCAMAEVGLEPPDARYGLCPSVDELEHWLAEVAHRKSIEDRAPGDLIAAEHGGGLGHVAVVVDAAHDLVVLARARTAGGGRVSQVRMSSALRPRSCWQLGGLA